jgi:hypothetical protein
VQTVHPLLQTLDQVEVEAVLQAVLMEVTEDQASLFFVMQEPNVAQAAQSLLLADLPSTHLHLQVHIQHKEIKHGYTGFTKKSV